MVLTSTRTGKKYLTFVETEELSAHIEKYIYTKFKIKVHVSYHPSYLHVPVEEEGLRN